MKPIDEEYVCCETDDESMAVWGDRDNRVISFRTGSCDPVTLDRDHARDLAHVLLAATENEPKTVKIQCVHTQGDYMEVEEWSGGIQITNHDMREGELYSIVLDADGVRKLMGALQS